MDELQIVGNDIYYRGQLVARLTISSGTFRDHFIEELFCDELYEAEAENDRLLDKLDRILDIVKEKPECPSTKP